MKMIYIIGLIIGISCSSQSTSNYVLENSQEIKANEPIFINHVNRLLFKPDMNLFYMNMYFQNLEKKNNLLVKADSVEFTPYESYIHIFKVNRNESFVIIWETQYEQMPFTVAYYLFEDKLIRIGELEVVIACNKSDQYEFPIKDVEISSKNDNLEFIFSKDIYYKTGKAEAKLLKPDSLKYIFEISTQTLKQIGGQ